MKKKVEQFLKEGLQKEVNTLFAFACLNNDIDTVQEYLDNEYIDDLGYEGGIFAIYAAKKGNSDILKILYQCQKNNEVKQYQHDILNAAASSGQISCIEFLLEQGADPLELKGTSAYNNYQAVEEIFRDYELKLSGENNHVQPNNFIEQTNNLV